MGERSIVELNNNHEDFMWTQWLNGLLGIWIIIVPFISMTPSSLKTTLIISGILIAVIGFAGSAATSSTRMGGRA